LDALGHDWGDWQIITAATCTKSGLKRRECARCGETEEEAIGLVEHSLVQGKCEVCGYMPLHWDESDDGQIIVIQGTEIGNYRPDDTPWLDGNSKINQVRFVEGMKKIGSQCFTLLKPSMTVYIPKTVESLDWAFIRIPDSLDFKPTVTINYAGTASDWSKINFLNDGHLRYYDTRVYFNKI
jgi:hypothetical protein